MFQYDIGTGAPPYLRLKGRATDFVPPAEAHRSWLFETLLSVGPKPRKGSDFNPHRLSVRVDVGLRQAHPQGADTVESRHPLENCVGERLLQVVAAGGGQLRHLGAKEVVIPRS